MFLMDVNVLVYAYREDVAHHQACHRWLESTVNSPKAFGYSEMVMNGFLRVVTHPKVFETPSDLSSAMRFVNQVRHAQNAVCIMPSTRHWQIFTDCLLQIDARGNDVSDAYLAALTLEWNCQWVTMDKGFKRFKGLKCRNPMQLLSRNA
jgi:toxin-antitoxin system PIN domain toxin